MAKLPTIATPDPTLEAVDAQIEARGNSEAPRPYLGMSAIGEACERRLWFSFRLAARSTFDAATLRKFEDGHRGEDLMAARLRMVPGVKLYTLDPSTGRQFGFQAVGGHFRGNIDGAIQGLLQAPVAWHCWEHKVSEKADALVSAKAKHGEKAALAAWNPTYYAQAICYMHYSGMERHYLTCDTPGGRKSVSVRTNADKEEAEQLEAKARRIITAPEPPAGVSTDPAFWLCKGCPARPLCYEGRFAQVSCRTCVHATPELDGDGRWSCALRRKDLSWPEQQAACPEHRFIPALVPAEVTDASEQENWIEYRTADGFTFRNGPRAEDSYGSKELAALGLQNLRDPDLRRIRAGYLPHAEFVDGEAA